MAQDFNLSVGARDLVRPLFLSRRRLDCRLRGCSLRPLLVAAPSDFARRRDRAAASPRLTIPFPIG
jgi:hypothetical protein